MIRRVACPAAPAARRPAHLAPPATAAAAHAPAARRGARSRVGPRGRALHRGVKQTAHHPLLCPVQPLALRAAIWWQRGLRLDGLTLGLFGVIGPAFAFRRSAGRWGGRWSGGACAPRKKRKMRRKPSLGRARAACRDRRGAGRALAWPRLRHPVHGPPHRRVRREVRRAPSFASFARAPRCCRAEAGQPSCQTSCRATRPSSPGARGRSPIRLARGTRGGSFLIRHMSASGGKRR
jgi:hypothetical protein